MIEPQPIPQSNNPAVSPDSAAPVGFTPDDSYWTTDEVAAFLRVSTRTVFNQRKSGLPFLYVGGSVRFERTKVKDYFANNPNLQRHHARSVRKRKGDQP